MNAHSTPEGTLADPIHVVEAIEIDTVGVSSGEHAPEQIIALSDFIRQFGDGLLGAVQAQNPPVYQDSSNPKWDALLNELLRKPFDAQREVVHAICELLIQSGESGSVINGEMGTGKTLMGIATAAVLHAEGFVRTLVISPPHLVYKWRREIIQTVPHARVWILNGPDTLRKLLQIRSMRAKPEHPEFFILGRVRMRMGFDWSPSYVTRITGTSRDAGEGQSSHSSERQVLRVAACSHCWETVHDDDNAPLLDSKTHQIALHVHLVKVNHHVHALNARKRLNDFEV